MNVSTNIGPGGTAERLPCPRVERSPAPQLFKTVKIIRVKPSTRIVFRPAIRRGSLRRSQASFKPGINLLVWPVSISKEAACD